MFTDGASRFSSTINDINGRAENEMATANPLHDVFGGDSDDDQLSQIHGRTHTSQSDQSENVSDVRRLQGIHTTNGYRDGVSESKEKFLQEGFDEGYSLGAEIGAAAGRLIGVLEALKMALQDAEDLKKVEGSLNEARKELSVKGLYAPQHFGDDGIWKFDIDDAGDGDGDVTFRVVASKHPLIKKWTIEVETIAGKFGLRFESS